MQDNINKTIADNTGLIFKQLRKFNLAYDPDAESIGYEALYNAIRTYDDSKSIKFSTYATVCIYNALGGYVRHLNRKRQLEVISYNTVAYTDDRTEHEFIDLLESPVDIEENVEKQETILLVQQAYKTVYDRLTNENHKKVISLWHDEDYNMPAIALASACGVSQSYVSQIINKFKFALKKELEAHFNE